MFRVPPRAITIPPLPPSSHGLSLRPTFEAANETQLACVFRLPRGTRLATFLGGLDPQRGPRRPGPGPPFGLLWEPLTARSRGGSYATGGRTGCSEIFITGAEQQGTDSDLCVSDLCVCVLRETVDMSDLCVS